MTPEQATVFAIIGLAIVLFIWDRWRYDLVALFILLVSVMAGAVPAADAFTGFSDPVVITVAAILVISAAISQSGFIDWSLKILGHFINRPYLQIFVLVALVTALSAFMNNIGALAVFLPVALVLAKKSNRSPSELLMPLAFGSLLGGLTTLIGTPPNLLISNVREEFTGEPYKMFDFAPVGLSLAIIGTLYLAIGWRLIPKNRQAQAAPEDLFTLHDYISEVVVSELSPIIGKSISEIETEIEGDFSVVALIRNGVRRLIPSGGTIVQQGDILAIETDPAILTNITNKAKLELAGSKDLPNISISSDEIGITEAVIARGSQLIGSTPKSLSLRSRFSVNLLAVRQTGKPMQRRLGDVVLREGDVIVLQGGIGVIPETLQDLGCLPLAERKLKLGRTHFMILPVIILAIAIMLTITETLPISISFLGAVVAIGILKILKLNEMYESINGSVVVLLAAMIPVTQALQDTGGSNLIAEWVSQITTGMHGPAMISIVLIASMIVTPFLNNAASVLLMGPIAAGLAIKMGHSIDPYLMAVAIGTSCDFLTPIGHQSNTLVMGPGGYKFGDYWRLGLPLSILVVAAGVPLILWAWPLHP